METKMIRMPFEVELAKRIQGRECEGKIVTRDGRNVRVICWDRKNNRPIIALTDYGDDELCGSYLINGRLDEKHEEDPDIMLEIPEYMAFKDGDVVTFGWKEGVNNCKWVSIFKELNQNCCIDYKEYVSVILESTRWCDEYICFDKDCDSATFARYSTEEEKQKLIDALKASKDPRSKECLKKLGIDVNKEYEFKPKDWVLCRASENDEWSLCIFSHKSEKYNGYVVIGGIVYKDCIPYNDSTKHLLGTKENYE